MNFKRIFSIILAVVLFVSMMSVSNLTSASAYGEMRDITAYELVSKMGAGINIGNSLDSACGKGQDETAWGNPRITKELILAYKNAGFSTIRLPVTWRGNIDADGIPNSTWLNRVQEVVDMILEEDLYCILNTHHEQNWVNTNSSGMETRKVKFHNLWTSIAVRFKNYGDHLLFEGYNEILKKESDWSGASSTDYKNANILSQVFVDAVRKTGGNNAKRILIISTYGAIRTTEGFVLPTDTIENKLAVEFHCYDPHGFCFADNKTKDYWDNSVDSMTMENACYEFYTEYVVNKIPVILGEYGAVNKNNTLDRAAYANSIGSICSKYKIMPVWWDDGIVVGKNEGSFGLIDRVTYEVVFPQIVREILANVTVFPTQTVVTTSKTKVTTPSKTYQSSTIPTTEEPKYIPKIKSLKVSAKNTIKLIWEATADTQYYEIYRKFEKSNSFEYLETVTSDSTTYYDYSANGGGTYFYQVKALNVFGEVLSLTETKSVKMMNFKAKPSITLSKLSKGFKVKLKSKVANCSGYEIQYSLKKNMKSTKSVSIKSSAKNKSIKKLKGNKRYYVRIRAYRLIDGKKVSGNWSAKKVVTTKK